VRELEQILGEKAVLWDDYDLRLYEYDGSIDKHVPEAVVFPTSAKQVSEVVKLCNRRGIPYTARGAGTGLSGGAIPVAGGLLISFSRMNRVLEVDLENLRAVVEPGLVNLRLSQAVAPDRLQYIPDPSSQKACTIGGNVAENSGGPHCLAYGVTTNHVVGLEVVLPDGEVVWLGGRTPDRPGYDLVGAFIGSEGMMGVATKIVVRLLRKPAATQTLIGIFGSIREASQAVSTIIGQGVVPACLEMMDRTTIKAVEPAVRAGYPADAEAVLLVEVEGFPDTVADQVATIQAVCHECGAREVRTAQSPDERERLWSGRKGAFGALGRLAPNYYIQDGVVPRTKLPQVLEEVRAVAERYGLTIANVFHAGDGNLHPCILFDARRPGETEKVIAAGGDILRACVDAGGTITGEHGVGMEKQDYLPWIFSEEDQAAMLRLRRAFNPTGNFNPGKVFPSGRPTCGELNVRPQVAAALGPDAWI
ncbi:MAG TPA: FAD-linked oxidase C-terminal domain-containing protein, partial [Dehalococcoidia bacterium]|nr:FAD-linked oxidase C-terminal domain-containing protein [Dehalococcoidia bacterium]